MYVAPFKKEVSLLEELKNKDKGLDLDGKKKKGKEPGILSKLWTSSMEEDSSSEDFEYLQQYLEENKTLPYGAMKLLRGCVSA